MVADPLSRKSLHMAILMVRELDIYEMKESQKLDVAVVDHLSVNEDEDFKVGENGILKFRNRVYVSDVPKLKKTILEESH